MGSQLSFDRFVEQTLDCNQCRCMEGDPKMVPQSNSGSRVPVRWTKEHIKKVAEELDLLTDMERSRATSLHHAAAYGDINGARECLASGIKANVLDEDGRTPFFVACRYGKSTTAKELLKHGADPKIGKRALDDPSVPERVKQWLRKLEHTKEPTSEDFMEFHTYQAIRSGLGDWNGRVKTSPRVVVDDDKQDKKKKAVDVFAEDMEEDVPMGSNRYKSEGKPYLFFKRINPQLGPDTVRLLQMRSPRQT